MAVPRRFLGQSGKLIKTCYEGQVQPAARAFYSCSQGTKYPPAKKARSLSSHQGKRAFSASFRRNAVGQEAPSAKAYVESGVIAGAKNPVDVKKVLVIGSGGLSIGQAGEFDYSGMLRSAVHCTRGGARD